MRGAARAGRQPAVVPHARPWIGPEEEAAALRVLRSGWLLPGPESARAEAILARLAGGADAVLLGSGTLALALALRALGVRPGERVAIPAYGCAALVHGVRAAGAEPLPCDIERAGLAIDAADLGRRAAAPPRAIVLVHPFGLPARLEALRPFGAPIVEDCAQALGAVDRGRPVGARGDAAVFSFAPAKIVTCGGPGGGLAAPQASVVRLARDLATHDERDEDRVRVNGLLGDLRAAVLLAQLERLREITARRAAIAARYDAAFAARGFERPGAPDGTRPVHFRYLVRVPDAAAMIARLEAEGIRARRPVFLPLHRLLRAPGAFPETERAHAELVSLPLSPLLSEEEIERVIAGVGRCRP